MTLPHGFGASGRCTKCGEHLYNKPCEHCNPPTKINIPITKKQLGLGIWYGLLSVLFIWALIDPHFIGLIMFFMAWVFGQIILTMFVLDSFGTHQATWRELMPWWIPFYLFGKLFSGKGGAVSQKFKWKEYKER